MKIIDLFLKNQKTENVNNFLVDTTKGMVKYETEIRVIIEKYLEEEQKLKKDLEEQTSFNEMMEETIISTIKLKDSISSKLNDIHLNNVPFDIYNSIRIDFPSKINSIDIFDSFHFSIYKNLDKNIENSTIYFERANNGIDIPQEKMEELKGVLFKKSNLSTNNIKSILKQYNIQSIHLITGNNIHINKITTHNESKLVLDFALFKNLIELTFNDYSKVSINNSKFSLMKIRVNNMSKLEINNCIFPENVEIYSHGFGIVEINNIKTNKLNLFSFNQSKIKINSIYLKNNFNVSSYDLSLINIESIKKDTDLNNEQIKVFFKSKNTSNITANFEIKESIFEFKIKQYDLSTINIKTDKNGVNCFQSSIFLHNNSTFQFKGYLNSEKIYVSCSDLSNGNLKNINTSELTINLTNISHLNIDGYSNKTSSNVNSMATLKTNKIYR